jgi:hypothetical protein
MDDVMLNNALESFPERKQLDAILSKFLAPGEKWNLVRVHRQPADEYWPTFELSTGVRPTDEMTRDAWQAANSTYKQFSQFSLCQFPGCCGIMVSYHAHVHHLYTKVGLGTILNKLRIHIARWAGYTYLMATDLVDNEPQRKILKKNEWEDLLLFRNIRTDNKLALSVIEL